MRSGSCETPSAATGSLAGKWINDSGSILDLRVDPDGRVTGTFRLASDGTSYLPYGVVGTCAERVSTQRGVVGSVKGWPSRGAVTVFCAEYDAVADVLVTTWLMSSPADRPVDRQDGIGHEVVFRRAGRRAGSELSILS